MRLPVTFVVCVAVGVLALGRGESLARRPGELGDRHFRSAKKGSGVLSGRMERRKEMRATERKLAVVKAEGVSATNGATGQALLSKSDGRSATVRDVAKKKTVRIKQRGPGRGGRGTGPVTRRRVVLKPLFGG